MMLLAFEMNLRGGGVHLGAVVEVGVPVAAALRGEVHEVPDGSEQVDAALADIGGHPRMRGVEVAEGAVGVAGENGNGGVLTPFAVFAPEVVLEGAVAGAEDAQLVPAARERGRAEWGDQRQRRRRSRDSERGDGPRRWRRRARRCTWGMAWSGAFRT